MLLYIIAAVRSEIQTQFYYGLLGHAQPVIPPRNLYSAIYVYEHNSLGSPGKSRDLAHRSERSGSSCTFTINPINVITHVQPYNACPFW